jgi:hypothetical protein
MKLKLINRIRILRILTPIFCATHYFIPTLSARKEENNNTILHLIGANVLKQM